MPLIVRGVKSLVAELAFPLKLAVIVPAEKLPFVSRETMELIVLVEAAVVAEFDTFPNVAIVASLVSTIAAAELMSALTIEPAAIAVGMMIFAEPSKDCAVPVTSPETFTVRGVASFVALLAFPVTDPVTSPVTLPEKVPVIVPAEKFPDASL